MEGERPSSILNVGIIGCGDVAQIVHIPTLNHLSDYFHITYLCDVSPSVLRHCAGKVSSSSNSYGSPGVSTTQDPTPLCESPNVDVVFILSSTEFHTSHAVLALKNNKHVFLEKPMALNTADVEALLAAEKQSRGKVMIGYMRRYAPAFVDAVKEIGGMGQIRYARVRDIIGDNALFINQSATFPKRFQDISERDQRVRKEFLVEMVKKGLTDDLGIEVTKQREDMWMLLGSLGSHDLSAMREALGMPEKVLGCSLDVKNMFWNVLFQYPGFAVSYESGIHGVPLFDAHLEIYSEHKQIRVQYDTPFVKGLPITMTIREDVEPGSGALRETIVRKTYEDPYTVELRELHQFVTTEGAEVKTTISDAAQDLEIFQMIMKAGAE